MNTSIIVNERMSVTSAAMRVALTVSANCSLVASAINADVLATDVAARSAALQLEIKLALAEAMLSWAEPREIWSRNATKRRDRIGKAKPCLGKVVA